jgi:hypothetical protein
MANRTEQVLLEVKINQSAAKKQAEELTVAIRKERNELAGLEKQYESGEITEKEYGAEKVRLTKSITENSRQLTINTNVANTNNKSIAAQRAELARLTDAYVKAVNPTKAEAKAIKELSDSLKVQEAEIGNNTRNVGNYSESILNAANNIPFLSGAIANCQQALVIAKASFGSFSGFLKSGFVGAVALAAASLASFFKATGEGEDVLERITARAKGFGSGIVQNLANAGKAFKNADGFISGIKAFDAYLKSDEAAKSIRDNTKAYLDNAVALQNMEDAERAFKVTVSERRLEIDKLLLTAKDLSLSDEQQIENLEKVKQLETELNAQEVAFARVRVANAQRLIDAVKDPTDELRDNLADAQVELNRLIGESALVQQTADNRISTQRAQQEAKRLADQKVISDAIRAEQEYDFKQATDATKKYYTDLDTLDLQHRLDSLHALNEDEIARTKIKRDSLEKQYQDLKKFGKDTTDVENQLAQTNLQIARETIQKEINLQNERLDALTAIGGAIGNLQTVLAQQGLANTEFSKALGIAQIAISTGVSLVKAISAAAGEPFPANLVAIATSVGAILAAVSQASQYTQNAQVPNAPQFGGGGDFLTQGPQMIMVGDNPGGVERVTVEPLSGRGQTKVGKGANLLHLAGGGSVTAFGGGQFAQQTIINQVNNQAASNKQIVDGIQGRVPVLVVETLDRVTSNMQRVIEQSTV